MSRVEAQLSELEERLRKLEERVEEKLRIRPVTFREALELHGILKKTDSLEESAEMLDRAEEFLAKLEENYEEMKELYEVIKETGLVGEIQEILNAEGFTVDLSLGPVGLPVDKEERWRLRAVVDNIKVETTFDINGKLLRDFFRALHELTNEARLRITSEGLTAKVVDPTNVCLIIVKLPQEVFEYFSTNVDRVVGIEVGRIVDYFKNGILNHKHTLSVTVTETQLIIENSKTGRKISLATIDPSAVRREPKVPEMEFEAEIIIDNFMSLIRAHKAISDKVVFEVRDGEACVRSEGDIEVLEDVVDGRGEGRAMYSTEYLEAIGKGVGNSTVTVSFKTDHPAKFECRTEDGLELMYLLAPRVEAV